MIRLSAFADEISADPVEQVDVLERLGVRNIEFRGIHGTNVLDLSRAQHEEFRSLLRRRGFGLSAIASPIGKVMVTEPFEPHLERFRPACELAEFYGTPRIRVFSYYMPEGDDPAQHRDEVLRRMAVKTAIAAERGLILVLENERRIYGDNAARVIDVLRSVDSPALTAAFDPANFVEVGESIDTAWELLADRTGHFHVKDYDPSTGRNVPAGEGAGQIPRLLADASSRGFDGFCVLEPHLLVAGVSHGFTGPERFGDATRALKSILDRAGIGYA